MIYSYHDREREREGKEREGRGVQVVEMNIFTVYILGETEP